MDDLNVSRTTIREAVKILISKNILDIERGEGKLMLPPYRGLRMIPMGLSLYRRKS